MFSCFNPEKTPGRRCEWKGGNLQDFTSLFNQSRGTTYELEACLDAPRQGITSPGFKQPEVLLKGRRGERPMVIERKQVVAQSYAAHHGNMHLLCDMIHEDLAPRFRDAPYLLEFNDASLRGRRKKEVQAAASEIAGQVVANLDGVKGGAVVGGRQPFPWRFGRVPAHARDDSTPESGVGVEVHGSGDLTGEPQALLRQIEEAYAETKGVLERRLAEASPKFIAYPDHLKVVVLEFYGDRNLFDEDDAMRMVGEVELPALIDEVWVARPEWVSEWDYEIGYDRAR